MPGIFGAMVKGTGNGASLLEQMANCMRHHDWYIEDRGVLDEGAVAFGALGLEVDGTNHLVCSQNGVYLAVFHGYLSQYELHRADLEHQGVRFQSNAPAELFLRGYQHKGPGFFSSLQGHFVAAIWDGSAEQLLLVTDRFGMRPLYYSSLHDRILFASEIKALLVDPGVSRTLSLSAIAQFFHFGQVIDDSTFYQGVQLLPAASILRYDRKANQVSIEPYWRLADAPAELNETKQDVLDRIADAFERAVRRTTSGPAQLGLSLSGGLDARTILGCVPDDRQLTTLCLGMEGSMDLLAASQMARLVGRPHHEVLLDDQFLTHFEDHLRSMVQLTDGHYLCQCIVMPTLPVYRKLGIQALLRGHAGELMHMTKAYNFSVDTEALTARDDATIERWLWHHLQAYLLDGTGGRLFAAPYRGQMEEMAREALRSRQRPLLGLVPPAQQIWRLFLDIRLRRETALSLVEFGSLVETRLPYLDNELIDVLLAAPPELKLDETIQRHILSKARPAFLKVINVNTGAPMTAGPWGRLFGKVRQKVFAKLGVKGYQPYERLGLWLRRELRPLVESILLAPQCLERGLFDPQEVRNVVSRHLDNKANHTFLLLAMMIFEVGQRTFRDEEVGSPRASGPLVVH